MGTEGRASEFAIQSGGHVFNVQYGRPLRVGRDPACEICLESSGLSRIHAWFWLERGEVWVEDLGSRNGVFVNGIRIRERTKLALGDDITVGDRTLTLTTSELERSDTQPVAVPEGVHSATRPTEQGRTVYEVFLDVAKKALREGRPQQAARAMDHIFGAIEASESAGHVDLHTLDAMTPVIAELALAARNATWVELLIALRHSAERPLDPVGAAELARAIEALPAVDDAARRAYLEWRRGASADAGEAIAIERLAQARGRTV